MAPRYALARRKARNLLQECHIVKPPVPVKRLTAQCGAILRFEPFDGDISGIVSEQTNGLSIIGVNSTQSSTRQRFTIAHEIGHLLLHKGEDIHIDEKPLSKLLISRRDDISSLAIDDREIEANQFAAELLMPEEFIHQSVGDLDPETSVDEAIESLSRLFQVSPIAITYRLTNLGILDSPDEVAG